MIKLTRLNKSEFYLNPDLIKSIEETPDTIIKLINDDHFLVQEKAEVVIDKIVAFRVKILQLSRQDMHLNGTELRNSGEKERNSRGSL